MLLSQILFYLRYITLNNNISYNYTHKNKVPNTKHGNSFYSYTKMKLQFLVPNMVSKTDLGKHRWVNK